MKFGKKLRHVAYEPWTDCYVDWRRLKKAIRAIAAARKSRVDELAATEHPPAPPSPPGDRAGTSSERTPLVKYRPLMGVVEHGSIQQATSSTSAVDTGTEDAAMQSWLTEFECELRRVEGFFLAELQLAEIKRKTAARMATERAHQAHPEALIKKTFFDALLIAEELCDFARLNLVGFSKLARKFVKHTGFLDGEGLAKRTTEAAFVSRLPQTDVLKDAIKTSFAEAYPIPGGTIADAALELVQSVTAARSWKRNTILVEFDDYQRKATLGATKNRKSLWPAVLAAVCLLILLFAPIMSVDDRPAQRCLGIVLAATILWVSECWPLFVTSLLIPLFVTMCYVLRDAQEKPLGPTDAAKLVFTKMFPNNIPLILAGFSIAQAFARYGLDVKIALLVLRGKFWRTPRRFLIAVELLCFFMSMFISNVASSVLLLTITMPIIRGLPKRSVYAKTLLLATAVSGNIGGMTTQVASPQNAVSAGLGEYSVDFIHFSMITLPLTPFLLVLGHLLVVWLFPPDIAELPKLDMGDGAKNDVERAAQVLYSKKQAWSGNVGGFAAIQRWWRSPASKQWVVLVISLVSVILWATSPWLKPFGCSIGVISLVPLGLFYGFGLLGKTEFEAMPWALTILIAGGNTLGYAVESSELLQLAAALILKLPQSIYLISAVSCLVMMVAGSFVSHTVAALILLRLFARVGEALGHAKLMVMTSIVVDSGAMPLPISSFPNINSFSIEAGDGEAYLKTSDFLKVGIPCTVLAYIGANTITYGMALLFKL